MKALFALLLLLIVTAATVTPCCVYEDCGDEAFTVTNNQSEDDREGACSPFFSCASCSGFVRTTKPVQPAAMLPAETVYFEAIAVHKPQAVYFSFWQPPRAA